MPGPRPALARALLAITLAAVLAPRSVAAAPAPAKAPAPAPANDVAPVEPDAGSFKYPYLVKFFSVSSQRQPALKMAFMDEKPAPPAKENGQVVLLLHGKNFSGAYWGPTIAALVKAGYRVIAPDQIGFGKSAKPESYQYSFNGLAAATDMLLESLGVESAHVVGHSMGGMLAVRFALLFPKRTRSLALVNPIGLEDYARAIGPQSVDVWFGREQSQTPDSIRAYHRNIYYGGQWKPEYEVPMRLQAGFTRHAEYKKVAWVSALTFDMILSQPVVHELDDVRARTLLIIGTADRTAVGRDLAPPAVARTLGDYTKLGKQAARQIRGAKLVELPGVGHMPHVEAFDKYLAALTGFLAK